MSSNNSRTSAIDAAMAKGGGVELPYQTAMVWVLNGDARMAPLVQAKQTPPAAFFGGWAATPDDFETMFDSINAEVVGSWKKACLQRRAGGDYEAYVTRQVHVAPFAMRESWVNADLKIRYPDYQKGARHHVQIVSYLFYQEKDAQGNAAGYKPLFPIVLTAKGYQARNLVEAINIWKRGTLAVRKRLGEIGASPFSFVMSIGTTGERTQKMVGPEGKQSPITPIELQTPDKVTPEWRITPEWMQSRYVGDELLATMNEQAEMSRDWMEAWRKEVDESQAAPDKDEKVPEVNPNEMEAARFGRYDEE